jgi:hypothetical protein
MTVKNNYIYLPSIKLSLNLSVHIHITSYDPLIFTLYTRECPNYTFDYIVLG